MFDSISSFAADFFTRLLHFYEPTVSNGFLYYLPALLCLIFYFGRSMVQFKKDVDKRRGIGLLQLDPTIHSIVDAKVQANYQPSLTYGKLFARFALSVIPVVNLWLTVTDILWEYVRSITEFFEAFFTAPIVADTDDHATRRSELMKQFESEKAATGKPKS